MGVGQVNRAVFLDRDGVLVRAAPLKEYAHGPLTLEDFAIFEGVAEPVARIREAGFLRCWLPISPLSLADR